MPTVPGSFIPSGAFGGYVATTDPTFDQATHQSGTYVLQAGTYATAATVVESSQVTGDSQARFTLAADGTHKWGSGSGATDCTLSRSGAGVLTVGNNLALNPGITSNPTLTFYAATYGIGMDGANLVFWGSGSQGISFRQDSNTGTQLAMFAGSTKAAPTLQVFGGQIGQPVAVLNALSGQTADLQRWQVNSVNSLQLLASGQFKTAAANEATGAGSALLGSNSPASTLTAPYTWEKITTSDGSQGYFPVWK